LLREINFVLKNTTKDWFRWFILLFLKIMIVVFGFTFPLFTQLIIDCGLNYNADESIKTSKIFEWFIDGKFGEIGSFKLILTLSICFIVTIILLDLCKYYQGTLSVKFRSFNRNRLRQKSFFKFYKCNTKYNNGELLNLLNDDVAGVSEIFFVNSLCIITDLFTIFMALNLLNQFHLYLVITPLITGLILLLFCIIYVKKLYNMQLTIRETFAQLRTTVKENVESIKSIKLFNALNFSKNRFSKKNLTYTTSLVEKSQLSNRYSTLFGAIKKFAYIVSLIVGGLLALYNKITIGEFLIFTTFVISLLDAIITIVSDFALTNLSFLSCRKFEDFLNTEDDILECDNPVELNLSQLYNLELNNVTVELNNKKVINNISLLLPAGKSLGVIGDSNSGKTAFIKSLMRILQLSKGKICVGDTQINNLKLENLRNLFSYNSQNSVVFNTTIKQNFLCANGKATEVEIANVLNCTLCYDFVSNYNINEKIEDGGNSFGVYKKRISLSRAILKESPFYVLDDFTNGYSSLEKKILCANILNILKNKTVIMIAESYNDIKDCDYVLELNNGKIEYFGSSSNYKQLEEVK
jgi:ABC-type multidrug transport system fused ATPase/permease subunit